MESESKENSSSESEYEEGENSESEVSPVLEKRKESTFHFYNDLDITSHRKEEPSL